MNEAQFEFEGLPVTYYHLGRGRPLLLIHGSGPGASSIGNWRRVLEPLAQDFEVFAMDLVGFGKSARKPAPPYFDYALWARQAAAMLARMPGNEVGVLGHSISGSLALTLAAREPRVAAVMTTGTMGAPFAPADTTRRCWTCPTTREELVLALSGLIHDTSVIDEAYLAAREPVVFAPGYADYFNSMFAGDAAQYVQAAVLSPETIAKIQCPVLLLHGRDDTAFPPSSSIEIAARLKHADLALLADCSHSVAFERTDIFLSLARQFFNGALPKEGA
ncbi:MAG TPA: alpha/beta hydrolase [Burkholderiales bacterium]|jgi:2-hydroxymuconate-semialdehyde hydrolase|nr:alpha/beta hydrolase [Burkholderiales bacterium]